MWVEVGACEYPPAEPGASRVAPLKAAITRTHQAILGGNPGAAPIPASSMWRDINCFNEMRIPALTYGPGVSAGAGTYGIKINDLIIASKLYAQIALDLCNQQRSEPQPQQERTAVT